MIKDIFTAASTLSDNDVMFTKELTVFLQELSKHNSKSWMDAHRSTYEKLRDEFIELIQAVLFEMSPFEPNFARLNPKHCIYRINRDIRFAKDKTPYKTYFSAALSEYGRKTADPAYYFHIDEQGILHLDGGLTSPSPKEIEAMRELISSRPEEVEEILNNKNFKKLFGGALHGEKLKTVPRGYKANDPYIELLKLKNYLAFHQTDALALEDNMLPKYITTTFKELHPFIKFCRKAVNRSK